MGSKNSGNSAAKDAYEEKQRQDRIRQGTENVDKLFAKNFSEKFYKKQRSGYTDYASPQLESQYGDAQKALTFDLARSGTLDSSIRADKFGELQKLYDTNKQSIADQAIAYEAQTRSGVEDARAGLVGNLNATGDAEGAVNAAIARSAALSKPIAYSPLTQLFSTFTGALGTQAAQEKAQALSGGSYQAKYDTGLFSGKSSVGSY